MSACAVPLVQVNQLELVAQVVCMLFCASSRWKRPSRPGATCQEGGRLARDLSTPANPLTYMTTSLSWLLTSTIVSSLSTLILSVSYLSLYTLPIMEVGIQ